MTEPSQYVDRRTGELCSDAIHARSFLDWCHNSRLGWLATNALFCRGPASRLYGWWHRRPWTRRKIRPFVERLRIDLTESVAPVNSHRSFADFIVRKIDLARRPVDARDDACVSPADARVLAYSAVRLGETLTIKRAEFDLSSLLDDEDAARAHDGGALLVCRLYLSDYHHFHFPAGGVPGPSRSIPGRYFAVTPYARTRRVPFFSQNHRMVTRLASDRFGRVTIVEVGAFTIGSIQQDFVPGAQVTKGSHKGCFALGASVIVLLFAPDAVELDADLLANTQAGHETYVRVGESIGRAVRSGKGGAA